MKLPCRAFQMGGLQCPPVPHAALEEVPSVLCCRGRGKGAGSSAHQASMDTKRTRFSLFSYKSAIYMLGWLRQQIPNRSRSARAELPCSGFTPCIEAVSSVGFGRRWSSTSAPCPGVSLQGKEPKELCQPEARSWAGSAAHAGWQRLPLPLLRAGSGSAEPGCTPGGTEQPRGDPSKQRRGERGWRGGEAGGNEWVLTRKRQKGGEAGAQSTQGAQHPLLLPFAARTCSYTSSNNYRWYLQLILPFLPSFTDTN